jgi:transposase
VNARTITPPARPGWQLLPGQHVAPDCDGRALAITLGETDTTQERRGPGYRAHAARLYPTASQAAKLDRQGHTARALWNLLHEWYTCRNGGIAKRPSIAEIDRQLRAARIDPLPGWAWLGELPAQATQQVLKHYLRTWDWFYDGRTNPPRFKRRSSRLVVDIPQASNLRVVRLSRRWGELTIPFVGRVRFRWTRPLPGVSRHCPGRITGGRLIKDPLRRRQDWLHKQTTDVAAHHGLVVLEELQIKSMTRSARGTVDRPGRHVSAKASLNRSILGMAWGSAGRMLAY